MARPESDPPEVSQPDTPQHVISEEELESLETLPPDPDDIERSVRSEPVEDAEGNVVIVAQQNMGTQGTIGGGEFPDPNTPPSEAAPGGQDPKGGEAPDGPYTSREP